MKFLIITFAVWAVVAADVSHLNHMYLPPVLEGLASQQQDVVENSILEDVKAQEEAQRASGQLIVKKVKFYDPIQDYVHLAEEPIPNANDDFHQTSSNDQSTLEESQQVQDYAHQPVAAMIKAEYSDNSVTYQHNKPIEKQHQEIQQHKQYSHDVNLQEQSASPVMPQNHLTKIKEQIESEQAYSNVYTDHYTTASAPFIQNTYQQHHTDDHNDPNSILANSFGSAGIDTQYAANGGYVY